MDIKVTFDSYANGTKMIGNAWAETSVRDEITMENICKALCKDLKKCGTDITYMSTGQNSAFKERQKWSIHFTGEAGEDIFWDDIRLM